MDQVTGKTAGTNILHRKKRLHAVAKEIQLTEKKVQDCAEKALAHLYALRANRIHPGKDDKILTDWNGLMITAFARAAHHFQKPEYAVAAAKAADFILTRLCAEHGRLLHRYRDGDASLPAHADDYAFFISGLIELYLTTSDSRYLEKALELNHGFIRHFWDHEHAGFFFTADDGEKLLVRKREIYDGAMPSGNSMALFNLVRLARITEDPDIAEMAAKSARSFYAAVREAPTAYAYFLSALDLWFGSALGKE